MILALSWLLCCCASLAGAEKAFTIDPEATIKDSPTTLLGVNHIGLSVKDLDRMVDFYKTASRFEVIRREIVKDSRAADTLFGRKGVEYEVAVLAAPNMLFELRAFRHNAKQAYGASAPSGSRHDPHLLSDHRRRHPATTVSVTPAPTC